MYEGGCVTRRGLRGVKGAVGDGWVAWAQGEKGQGE